jgi:hypothetical protein
MRGGTVAAGEAAGALFFASGSGQPWGRNAMHGGGRGREIGVYAHNCSERAADRGQILRGCCERPKRDLAVPRRVYSLSRQVEAAGGTHQDLAFKWLARCPLGRKIGASDFHRISALHTQVPRLGMLSEISPMKHCGPPMGPALRRRVRRQRGGGLKPPIAPAALALRRRRLSARPMPKRILGAVGG